MSKYTPGPWKVAGGPRVEFKAIKEYLRSQLE
jgi:hypothetical protein